MEPGGMESGKMDEAIPAERALGPVGQALKAGRWRWFAVVAAVTVVGGAVVGGAAVVGAGSADAVAPAGGPAPTRSAPTRSADDGPVAVTGSGFGHGVGLTQYGALGMARNGSSARSILTHYYTGTTVEAHPDDVDLRVNVVDRGTSVSLATKPLAAGGGALRLVTAGNKVIDLAAGNVVTVAVEGGSLRVTSTPPGGAPQVVTTRSLTVRWSGARALAGPASVLMVASRSANAASTSGKTRSYRWGALQFTPVARTDTDGVARTRIEGIAVLNLHREYLRGIAEMPSSWPAAALQAQVIAARNYALTEYRAGLSADCGGCHLWDDTRSQVYRGWGTESVAPRWVSAVTATQTSRTTGLVVLYQGEPVRAYYSSSSGGRTRDARSAWGTEVAYLRGVDDPWSVTPSVNPGYAQWRRTVSRAKVTSVFGLPDVIAVQVTERDASGAAITVRATASDGATATVPGATVRSRLGLPAPWLTSFDVAEPAPPTPTTSTTRPGSRSTSTGGPRKDR